MATDGYTTCTLILGTNGTGKTTLAEKMIQAELSKPNGRVLVVTPDDREYRSLTQIHPRFMDRIATFDGARRLIFMDGDLEKIRDHFSQGLLVLDDCRAYLDATTKRALHELLIRRRQRNIDIVMVAHGFNDLPPKAFIFASHYVIFKTLDSIKVRKQYIRNYDVMERVVQGINSQGDIHKYEVVKVV